MNKPWADQKTLYRFPWTTMISLLRSFFKTSTPLCLILALSGCGVLPLAPIAVSGAAGGVTYTMTNVAYKTLSHPLKDVEAALHKALMKMEIKEEKREAADGNVSITAATKRLAIYIDIEKITPRATRIKVNAKQGAVLKDRATATEIIVQTEKSLE